MSGRHVQQRAARQLRRPGSMLNRPRGREEKNIPFGWRNSPFSTPVLKALLKSLSNIPSPTLMVLLALMYFLRF